MIQSITRCIYIAFHYLLCRRGGDGNNTERYLLGAACGIALSFIPIIVTLIVADGMIQGITDRFLELGTGHIRVTNFGASSDGNALRSLEEAREKLGTMPDIRASWIERQGIGIIYGTKNAKRKEGAVIRSIDPSFWSDSGAAPFLDIIEGDAALALGDALLGKSLAEKCGVHAGDKIRVLTVKYRAEGTNENERTRQHMLPQATTLTVRGIVSSGYNELDALWCVVNESTGGKILSPAASQSFIVVKIAEPYRDAEAAAFNIEKTLGDAYLASTWKDLAASQYASYETTRQLLLFIMALIILVAAVNVSAATSMLAIEKQRDIAILKTFGVGAGTIRTIFTACGFVTGLAGSILGVAAGLAVGCNINGILRALETVLSHASRLFHGGDVKILDPGFYLSVIPIVVNKAAVALIAAFSVAAATLAAVFPARRAAREHPIELLRKV